LYSGRVIDEDRLGFWPDDDFIKANGGGFSFLICAKEVLYQDAGTAFFNPKQAS